MNTKQIPIKGGILCDEVGLGKTLSMISFLVTKHKHDMQKFSKYYENLQKWTPAKSNDPLDCGFEYNNLIIFL